MRTFSLLGWFPVAFIFSLATLARAEMHLPRVERERLIFAPSFNLAPVAPVAFALSDPAKSTKQSLHNLTALLTEWTVEEREGGREVVGE
jgi:hypothetical protein